MLMQKNISMVQLLAFKFEMCLTSSKCMLVYGFILFYLSLNLFASNFSDMKELDVHFP